MDWWWIVSGLCVCVAFFIGQWFCEYGCDKRIDYYRRQIRDLERKAADDEQTEDPPAVTFKGITPRLY
jgi:hypothetical protein